MADINVGQLAEAINDKADRNLRNVDNTAGADAVIDYQEPTADNGYTWYRKYASGWVEQGGYTFGGISASTHYTRTLPIAMANTNFWCCFGQMHGIGGAGVWGSEDYNLRTTTSISVFCSSAGFQGFYWEVKGIAAN